MNALLTEKENKDLKKQLAKAKLFTGLKSNDKSDNYWVKQKPKKTKNKNGVGSSSQCSLGIFNFEKRLVKKDGSTSENIINVTLS